MGQLKSKAGSGKPKQATPISSHRFFPAIVALWFAALFGLGSLVLPAALFDEIASASHIGALIPAMAPPLGLTARMLIALAAAVGGTMAGLWLARKVVAAQAVAPIRRRDPAGSSRQPRNDYFADPGTRRPLSASEDLHLDSLDSEAPFVGDDNANRRRGLATTEESGLSNWLRPLSVSLPGEGEGLDYMSASHIHGTRADRRNEALELDAFALAEPEPALEPAPAPFAAQEPAQMAPQGHDALPRSELAPAEQAQVFIAPASPREARAPAAQTAPECRPESGDDMTRPHLPFAPPVAIPAEVAEMSGMQQAPASQQAVPVELHALANLDIGELSERLHAAIAARRQLRKAAPFIAETPIAEDGGVQSYFGPVTSAVPADSAATSDECAPLSLASTIPAALRPIDFGEFDEDEDVAGLSSLRLHTRPKQGNAGPLTQDYFLPDAADDEAFGDDGYEAIDDEEDRDSASYSSLLTMKNPFAPKAEYIRIDEPQPEYGEIEPAVVFPGQDARRNQVFSAMAESDPFADAAPVQPDLPAFTRQDARSAAPSPLRPFDPLPNAAVGATPEAAAVDPMETERALRAALATLQKMSGAA